MSKNTGRFHFNTSSSLIQDGSARTDQNKKVWYRAPPNAPRKKFDDVFKLVDYLLYDQGEKDIEKIKMSVSDLRVFEDKADNEPLTRFSCPLVMAPIPVPELPKGFKEENRADIESTLMEMANYAIKCMTDNYMYLDEHLNLDLTELLPGEPPIEPSTDHTSSKKKERNHKNLEREHTPPDNRTKYLKTSEDNQPDYRAIREEQNRQIEDQLHVRRRLMKTAGQSPLKTSTPALNLGEESTPQTLEIDKFLRKRAPEAPIPGMRTMKVDKINHKKPSYVSRNASPPRSIPKTLYLDKDHPLNRNIDLSKPVKGGQPEPIQTTTINTTTEPIHTSKLTTELSNKDSKLGLIQKQINEKPNNRQVNMKTYGGEKQTQAEKLASSQQNKHTDVQAVAPPKPKQSCEQRVELTDWPADVKKSAEKPEKSSFSFNPENIAKYMNISNGHSALRNMSLPQKKNGDHITK